MHKLITGLFAATVLATSANGCLAGEIASQHQFKDATGVCFRRIEWMSPGSVVSNRYEVVLVQQSSSLASDMRRLKDIENGSFIKSPHLKPFVWLHAWIDDSAADFTRGPDCSKLPAFDASKGAVAGNAR